MRPPRDTMLAVSTAGASVASVSRPVGRLRFGAVAYVLVALGSAILIVAAALLLLLQPLYLHPALDASGSAALLGVSRDQAHRLSDQTVGELLFGPGTFAFAGPSGTERFYDASEAGHMGDVRVVLNGFLALALLSLLVVAALAARGRRDPSVWRAISRGSLGVAVAIGVAGLFSVVAFDRAFELFHRVLFPGGNWAFDPGRQRLVQLYPIGFWQLTSAAFGVLAIAGGLAVWALARTRVNRLAGPQA
jgi:hypothetical protein